MAGATVKFEVDDQQILRALKRVQRAITDMDPVWRDIGEHLKLSTWERWKKEQAPDGTPWEPLSEKTIRAKMLKSVRRTAGQKRKRLTRKNGALKAAAQKAQSDMQILVASGDLRDLMRYQINGNEFQFGSDRKYAATHQFGDPDRHIPARPFLGLTEEDRQVILDILARHLEAAFRPGA